MEQNKNQLREDTIEFAIELLYRKTKINDNLYRSLTNKCGSIRRKLIASVTTAKANK